MKNILFNLLLTSILIINSCVPESTPCTSNFPNVDCNNYFSPLGIFIDSRDGNQYATIQIGRQIWFAENLRYDTLNNWLNPSNPCVNYGRLYNWETAQNICPNGWHLPSIAEWNTLAIFCGGTIEGGEQLKSSSGWANCSNGNNASGFNAFPSGYYYDSFFSDLNGLFTLFWTSTTDPVDSAKAFSPYLGEPNYIELTATDWKHIGYPCRCLKD